MQSRKSNSRQTRRSLRLIVPAANLLLLVAGCSTRTIATDAVRVATAIGHVQPSSADTCETQQRLAAQSSRIDTIRSGKEVVYKARCKTEKPPPEPKTS